MITIPPDELIVIFLSLPSPNFQVDTGEAATPSASGLPGGAALHTARVRVRVRENPRPGSQSLGGDHRGTVGTAFHIRYSFSTEEVLGAFVRKSGGSMRRVQGDAGILWVYMWV